ncbi:unnamed protein product [Mesocestoides corti]|uniref:Uncharacterized protein n=1 Tax=Mesocestoides corti TaxID=53468 RepID=A0A0R3U376_MESCO|nr:unnamed protein product [Mesocestoides corti]
MNTYLGCVTTSDSRGSQFGRQKVQAVSSNHGPNLAATIDRIANASASRTHGYANNQESVQTVVLTRTQLDKPWGFRIQGGQDYNLQLTVKKNKKEEAIKGISVALFRECDSKWGRPSPKPLNTSRQIL